jgi:S1-C subfamily serine protease
MRSLSILVWLILGAGAALGQEAAPPAAPNPLEQLEEAVTKVVDGVRPSIVQVTVRRSFELEGGRRATDAVATSGIVWSADGHIVSLGRAFGGAESIEVALASGEKRVAALVGIDDETGIALLRIDTAGLREPLRPAPLGSAKRLRAGSIVVSVTNPFGLQGSAALGTVAGRDRVVRRGELALADVLQITTPVNPGDPGGALADARGEVVGIVASTYERHSPDLAALSRTYREFMKIGEALLGKQGPEMIERALREALGREREGAPGEARFQGSLSPFGGQGIGFAIPVDQARAVVERLKAEGKIERAWLGVQVVTLDPIVKAQLELSRASGVAIVGVVAGGPAEKAGLRQFDVVLRFAGRDVADLAEFKKMVLEAPPGKPVTIEVLRKSERISFEVVPAVRGQN